MTDDTKITPEDEGGLSRRDMLRRSALVGGTVVWMAPAVQTLASPAFAAGSPVQENPCEYIAFVKFDLPGVTAGGFSGSEGNATCALAQCASSNVTVTPTSATTADLFSGATKIGSVTASSITETCVTIDFNWVNAGCNVEESSSYFIFKDGNDTGTGGAGCEADDSGALTEVTTSAGNDTYRICADGGTGGGLLHVNLCLCIQCVS